MKNYSKLLEECLVYSGRFQQLVLIEKLWFQRRRACLEECPIWFWRSPIWFASQVSTWKRHKCECLKFFETLTTLTLLLRIICKAACTLCSAQWAVEYGRSQSPHTFHSGKVELRRGRTLRLWGMPESFFELECTSSKNLLLRKR